MDLALLPCSLREKKKIMPCYKPIDAWRSSELTSKGKNRIVFKQSGRHQEIPIQVPCGRCIGCRLERSMSWAIRCVEEAQLHEVNSFITLTYSPEHLPPDESLVKLHYQDFMRRLRWQIKPQKVRYYMCGEYGDKLTRPHYHACLFGLDFPDKEIYKMVGGTPLFTSVILEKIWGMGFVTIGEMTFESAAYCARYIAKKITGTKAEEHYTVTDPTTGEIKHLEPEYNCMSRKPGLAADWYERYKGDVFPSDFLIHKNKAVKVPRYFDNLHEAEGGDIAKIKKDRKIRAKRFKKDNTPERLAVREKVKTLNYQKLIRSYEQNDI